MEGLKAHWWQEHTYNSCEEMSEIYQHKTLSRPIDSRKNKGIGEIAVSNQISILLIKNPTVSGILECTYLNNDKSCPGKHSFK